jgi:hypothetical protein
MYGVISAISYIYLILQPTPGLSVPVFIILQFISIYYVIRNRAEVQNKKGILMMIPIFILALNYLISGNTMFRSTNYIVILLLYNTMILILSNELSIKTIGFGFIFNILCNIFVPLFKFKVPFKWFSFLHKNSFANKYKFKPVLLGILVSIPIVFFLIIMLSSADMIFSAKISGISDWFSKLFNFLLMYKFVIGVFAGLYLFGLLYLIFEREDIQKDSKLMDELNNLIQHKKIKGDSTVFNILLASILTVYTFFIIIQFKYLFAGANLPNGLNYSEYARRGFFELVFLSVLNITLILLTVYLLHEQIYVNKIKWSQITKIFLIYLCFITIILLVSSFYRMMLYNNEYGFTRLRVLVYTFLIFEAIGLFITFKFIMKPDFNIIAIYSIIGLIYYLSLNIMQIDYIIAKNNIDMYLANETQSIDIDYLMSLSVDVTPQIMRLIESSEVDVITKYRAGSYLEDINVRYNQNEKKWQSYNLSIERAKGIVNDEILQPLLSE